MKKILGIIGSPRKLGNSEIMIKEIARNIPEPNELRLLRLTDFNILACRGCYQCLAGNCILEDDIATVVAALCEADAIIVAAPTYFLGANAALKRFVDRGLSFYSHIDRLWGTPAVGVCIAGIEGKEGHGLLGVENFLKMTMAEIKKTRVVYGALPGEIFLDEENRTTAARLGEALFAPSPPSETHQCPLCGGDTFRFLGGNELRCMLCSNSGTLDTGAGSPVPKIERGDHELFLTKAEALGHKDWLVGMKSRFSTLKEPLKKVSLEYRQDGEWIKP